MKAPEVVLKQAEMSPAEIEERLDAIFEILFNETLKVFDFGKGGEESNDKISIQQKNSAGQGPTSL